MDMDNRMPLCIASRKVFSRWPLQGGEEWREKRILSVFSIDIVGKEPLSCRAELQPPWCRNFSSPRVAVFLTLNLCNGFCR